MLKRIFIFTLLLLIISTNVLIAQQEMTIPVGDTTIVYSKLNSFNAFSDAVGVDILSETEYSNTTHLRLWSTLSHSFAARFLDISIDSDQISGKWYATWADNSRKGSKQELLEKWNCISEIKTAKTTLAPDPGV